MKRKMKKLVCLMASFAIAVTTVSATPSISAAAKEAVGNGVVLSTDMLTVTESAPVTFTASIQEGADASRLTCVVADPNVAQVIPVAYTGNIAAFQVSYTGGGSTVAAVTHMDNAAVVAYLAINATSIIMEVPSKLGTSHSNYCQLIEYEFVPYDTSYGDFNVYKYTLNLKYKCVAYGDDEYRRWGCYGYFYDAAGTVLSKVHLYCSALACSRAGIPQRVPCACGCCPVFN